MVEELDGKKGHETKHLPTYKFNFSFLRLVVFISMFFWKIMDSNRILSCRPASHKDQKWHQETHKEISVSETFHEKRGQKVGTG